jgi:hypothetical protein
MSVDSMNSFLTCDEAYIIYEPANLACDSLLMWQEGALRTTDMIIGAHLAIIKMASGFSLDLLIIFGLLRVPVANRYFNLFINSFRLCNINKIKYKVENHRINNCGLFIDS